MTIHTQKYNCQVVVSNEPDVYKFWSISFNFDEETLKFEEHGYEDQYQLDDILNLP